MRNYYTTWKSSDELVGSLLSVFAAVISSAVSTMGSKSFYCRNWITELLPTILRNTFEAFTNYISHGTVLHFTSERLSPRFLPQNQIKFLSVKKFYFWLTAFCLASDNFKQEIEKYPSVVCFLAMFLVLQKVTINPYKNSKFPFMMH